MYNCTSRHTWPHLHTPVSGLKHVWCCSGPVSVSRPNVCRHIKSWNGLIAVGIGIVRIWNGRHLDVRDQLLCKMARLCEVWCEMLSFSATCSLWPVVCICASNCSEMSIMCCCCCCCSVCSFFMEVPIDGQSCTCTMFQGALFCRNCLSVICWNSSILLSSALQECKPNRQAELAGEKDILSCLQSITARFYIYSVVNQSYRSDWTVNVNGELWPILVYFALSHNINTSHAIYDPHKTSGLCCI